MTQLWHKSEMPGGIPEDIIVLIYRGASRWIYLMIIVSIHHLYITDKPMNADILCIRSSSTT